MQVRKWCKMCKEIEKLMAPRRINFELTIRDMRPTRYYTVSASSTRSFEVRMAENYPEKWRSFFPITHCFQVASFPSTLKELSYAMEAFFAGLLQESSKASWSACGIPPIHLWTIDATSFNTIPFGDTGRNHNHNYITYCTSMISGRL